METTNHTTRSWPIIVTAICLVVTLTCMVVVILRGDREGAVLLFMSAGIIANSLIRLVIR